MHFTAVRKTKPDVSEEPVSGKLWSNWSAIPPTAVVLVAVVAAVVGAVTLPKLWFATAVLTPQLRRVALCRQEEKCSVRARGHGRQSGRALTAVALVAVVPTVVPAVAPQRRVEAQVVVAPEASGTSWPIRCEDC